MAKFSGGRIVLVTFLALNCANGVTYGSFGLLITSIQRQFDVSRSVASMGMSMCLASMGLCSPLVGILARRWSAKLVLISGAILNVIGYLLLSISNSIVELLAVYGLLIGPGITALSTITCGTLVSRWFIQDRGKALGTMSLPIFIMVVPTVTSAILLNYGLFAVFLANSIVFALLLPFLFLIIERPEAVGQRARGIIESEQRPESIAGPELSVRDILRRKDFWFISIGSTIIAGIGIIMTVQLVPLLTGRGLNLSAASRILSTYAVILALGSLAYGWLADHIGAVRAYMVSALMLVAPWIGLVFAQMSVTSYVLLTGVAALSHGAMTALHAASVNELFGQRDYSRVMGLTYFFRLPAFVAAAPLAGYAYDVTGSYNVALWISGALALMAGMMFRSLDGREHSRLQNALGA